MEPPTEPPPRPEMFGTGARVQRREDGIHLVRHAVVVGFSRHAFVLIDPLAVVTTMNKLAQVLKKLHPEQC